MNVTASKEIPLPRNAGVIPAGTPGRIVGQPLAGLHRVEFTLPRRFDVERFGPTLSFTVECLSDEVCA